MTKQYLVTFKTDSKSDFGIDVFESMFYSFLCVHDTSRKAYHCWIKEVGSMEVGDGSGMPCRNHLLLAGDSFKSFVQLLENDKNIKDIIEKKGIRIPDKTYGAGLIYERYIFWEKLKQGGILPLLVGLSPKIDAMIEKEMRGEDKKSKKGRVKHG